MHTREFFYDNYKHHPDPVLKRIAGEYGKLTPEAQEALRDVLQERNMENLLEPKENADKKKQSLAHLSAEEIRVVINTRLERGEKLESIKMDLQDRGVNIFDLSLRESRAEEEVDERFMQLQQEGKSKAEIEAQLKKEFKLSGQDAAKIPERMHSNGSWLIVIGAVLLMVSIPLILVMLQGMAHSRSDFKLSGSMLVAGLFLLGAGLRKRMAAQRFIKTNGPSEKN